MTSGQLFTVAILKIVAPIITAYIAGWHAPQPSYIKKKPELSNSQGE